MHRPKVTKLIGNGGQVNIQRAQKNVRQISRENSRIQIPFQCSLLGIFYTKNLLIINFSYTKKTEINFRIQHIYEKKLV